MDTTHHLKRKNDILVLLSPGLSVLRVLFDRESKTPVLKILGVFLLIIFCLLTFIKIHANIEELFGSKNNFSTLKRNPITHLNRQIAYAIVLHIDAADTEISAVSVLSYAAKHSLVIPTYDVDVSLVMECAHSSTITSTSASPSVPVAFSAVTCSA